LQVTYSGYYTFLKWNTVYSLTIPTLPGPIAI
jgi:hypothetical protein